MFSRVFDRQFILDFHFITCDTVVFILACFTLDDVVLFFISCFILQLIHLWHLDASC